MSKDAESLAGGAVTLHEGDALAVLPTLASGSVNCVVTDPPYGMSNEKYDGPGAISLRPDVWRECYRVCGENAALVAFAGSPTYHRIATAIEAGGWKVRQMWAWVYRDGMITSAYPREGFDRLAPAMDPIVFATKGKALLALEREGAAWECWATRTGGGFSDRSQSLKARMQGNGHWPRSVVCSDGIEGLQYFALSRGADRQGRTGHPNQKPLPLMQWLVAKLPGPVILDPFAGSGTTALAALQEGRRAILVEKEASYCTIIRSRLASASASMPLFEGQP